MCIFSLAWLTDFFIDQMAVEYQKLRALATASRRGTKLLEDHLQKVSFPLVNRSCGVNLFKATDAVNKWEKLHNQSEIEVTSLQEVSRRCCEPRKDTVNRNCSNGRRACVISVYTQEPLVNKSDRSHPVRAVRVKWTHCQACP